MLSDCRSPYRSTLSFKVVAAQISSSVLNKKTCKFSSSIDRQHLTTKLQSWDTSHPSHKCEKLKPELIECLSCAILQHERNSYYTMHSIPAYRSIVEKKLHVPQTFENIITTAPSLDDIPVSIGSTFQSIPGTWRWHNAGTTPKLSSQHEASHSLVTIGQCVKWNQNVMLIIEPIPPNGKRHYMGIEAINQLVDFRHKTSESLKENVFTACDSYIGVVGQQERLQVPHHPFASITTPHKIHHKPMLVCDSIWQ